MAQILILRLQGVMQAWGKHSYEDYRPSEVFPTRSAVEGLLAACLGIEREDKQQLKALSRCFSFAVRQDLRMLKEKPVQMRKISDFHTVLDARKVDGSINPYPVVSRREYLCDGHFTVALDFNPQSSWTNEALTLALKKPVFTPFLGRRSCPITAPLFEQWIEAEDLHSALSEISPFKGIVYSELQSGSKNRLVVRDLPQYNKNRQFNTRDVFIHAPEGQ